jgi:dihydrofolate synthase/folylpolyglutamate synthase
MLGDKDVAGVVAMLRETVDAWYAATSEGARAIDAHELARRALEAAVVARPSGGVVDAMRAAVADAGPGDRIVVFGSFQTVGPALVSLHIPL